MRSEGGAPAPLPAPYESPERRLARDLRDLLASWRLRAWALWRRNGEGQLPRPRFWPQALAAWFWPLLAALGLALVAALTLVLLHIAGSAAAAADGAPAGGLPSAAAARPSREPDRAGEGRGDDDRGDGAGSGEPEGAASTAATQPQKGGLGRWSSGGWTPPSTAARPEGSSDLSAETAPEDRLTAPSPGGTAADSAETMARGDARSSAGLLSPAGGSGSGPENRGSRDPGGRTPSGAADAGAEPDAPQRRSDGERRLALLMALQGPEQGAWIASLQAQAPEGLLRLRLTPGYGSLAAPRRQELAEQWLERAQVEGYERLELLSPDGRLIGRNARVGSGMILLDPGLRSPP